jgi:monoamine oxidase
MIASHPVSRRRVLAAGAAGLATLAAPRWASSAIPEPDVLILGAGISGLHAARMLQAAGVLVEVLEGSPRIGGRCWTAYDLPGRPEFGAGTVGGGYGRVRGNAAELGVKLIAPPPGGRETTGRGAAAFSIDGGLVSRDAWADSPMNHLVGDERPLSPLALYARYINADMPLKELDDWTKPAFADLDRMSLRQYFTARGASPEALRLLDIQAPAANLDDANALHFVRQALYYQYEAKQGWGSKVRGGTSALTDAMAASLKRPVRVNQAVTRIEAGPERVTVTCADGSVHRARRCISTIPLSILKTLRVDGNVPPEQRQAWRAMRYTTVVEVYLTVESPFWEKDGAPPALWSDGVIEQMYYLPSPDSHGMLNAFVAGDGTALLDRMSPENAGRYVLDSLVRIRPAAAGAVKVRDVHNWGTYPFNRGHIATFAPGDIGRYQRYLRQPIGGLHFAGDHCGVLHVGLEAACEAAEVATLRVLDELGA